MVGDLQGIKNNAAIEAVGSDWPRLEDGFSFGI